MMKLKRKLKTGPVWNPLLSLNTLRVLYHLTLIFSILFIVADTNIFSLSLSLPRSSLGSPALQADSSQTEPPRGIY